MFRVSMRPTGNVSESKHASRHLYGIDAFRTITYDIRSKICIFRGGVVVVVVVVVAVAVMQIG